VYVLGLNIGPHDPSAALLRDGSLRWLVEQERISRRKHAVFESPAGAVRACLDAEGIGMDSVDVVAFGWDVGRTRLRGNRRFSPEGIRRWLFPELPPGSMPPVEWVPHHVAHAGSAYYGSGAHAAAILVVDAAGEDQATTLAAARGGRIEVVREWPVTQSLGFFYALASEWAGLGLHWGAGKLMGLAAYGRPEPGLGVRRLPAGYAVVAVDGRPLPRPSSENGSAPQFRLVDMPAGLRAAMTAHFSRRFPYAAREQEDAIAYADFAASVQHALEDAALGLVEEARRQVDAPVLGLAGGVAMNCTMVGRVARSGIFGRVYVPPVPTDAGVSLGAALVAASWREPFTPTVLDHPYWSLPIESEAAVAAVGARGLAHEPIESEARLADAVAHALVAGKLVGWARGRAEIGQRALGARSILADPRDRRSLERLNLVKGREMWRPVAPSVLAEHAGEVFEGHVADAARFMLSAEVVRPEARQRLPAVTHVDGSARPHLVDRRANPGYRATIERFRELTGVPAVVNTSFNLAGEPIVHTPADCVSTFVDSGLDLLVLGDMLVARTESELEDALAAAGCAAAR
jgi:predicted NodU family carbamoyl transferase